ncbi:MAG TPA: hypothetical protein VGL49_03595 [Acidimicrobiales bacterium]
MTAPSRARPVDSDRASTPDAIPARHRALMDGAAGIRVRRPSLPIDRILLATASILTPLGVVLIILAWYGAAHTPKVYEQIDYLISGGVLGATLTILGGFMYFGYWLTRQLQESRRENALALQAFRRLQDTLAGAAAGRRAGSSGAGSGGGTDGNGNGGGARPRRTPPGSPAAEDPTGEIPVLVATPRGNLLHRPDCVVVARRPGSRPVAPGTVGYGYCRLCDAAGVLT